MELPNNDKALNKPPDRTGGRLMSIIESTAPPIKHKFPKFLSIFAE
ncbi:MAG: hypothetical protein HRU09_19890 [Oligoflexales bacterium]|nr:hypothetical protein [Oligoflexales bacterium]